MATIEELENEPPQQPEYRCLADTPGLAGAFELAKAGRASEIPASLLTSRLLVRSDLHNNTLLSLLHANNGQAVLDELFQNTILTFFKTPPTYGNFHRDDFLIKNGFTLLEWCIMMHQDTETLREIYFQDQPESIRFIKPSIFKTAANSHNSSAFKQLLILEQPSFESLFNQGRDHTFLKTELLAWYDSPERSILLEARSQGDQSLLDWIYTAFILPRYGKKQDHHTLLEAAILTLQPLKTLHTLISEATQNQNTEQQRAFTLKTLECAVYANHVEAVSDVLSKIELSSSEISSLASTLRLYCHKKEILQQFIGKFGLDVFSAELSNLLDSAAAITGNADLTTYLLNLGASISFLAIMRAPNSTLERTAESGHANTLKCLLEHITTNESQHNPRAINQAGALSIAVANGQRDAVFTLLNHGANPAKLTENCFMNLHHQLHEPDNYNKEHLGDIAEALVNHKQFSPDVSQKSMEYLLKILTVTHRSTTIQRMLARTESTVINQNRHEWERKFLNQSHPSLRHKAVESSKPQIESTPAMVTVDDIFLAVTDSKRLFTAAECLPDKNVRRNYFKRQVQGEDASVIKDILLYTNKHGKTLASFLREKGRDTVLNDFLNALKALDQQNPAKYYYLNLLDWAVILHQDTNVLAQIIRYSYDSIEEPVYKYRAQIVDYEQAIKTAIKYNHKVAFKELLTRTYALNASNSVEKEFCLESNLFSDAQQFKDQALLDWLYNDIILPRRRNIKDYDRLGEATLLAFAIFTRQPLSTVEPLIAIAKTKPENQEYLKQAFILAVESGHDEAMNSLKDEVATFEEKIVSLSCRSITKSGNVEIADKVIKEMMAEQMRILKVECDLDSMLSSAAEHGHISLVTHLLQSPSFCQIHRLEKAMLSAIKNNQQTVFELLLHHIHSNHDISSRRIQSLYGCSLNNIFEYRQKGMLALLLKNNPYFDSEALKLNRYFGGIASGSSIFESCDAWILQIEHPQFNEKSIQSCSKDLIEYIMTYLLAIDAEKTIMQLLEKTQSPLVFLAFQKVFSNENFLPKEQRLALKNAFYNGDIHCCDENGNSALQLAVSSGDASKTRTLLAKGFDVNAKNTAEKTSFDIALGEGHADILKILLANDNLQLQLQDETFKKCLTLLVKNDAWEAIPSLFNKQPDTENKYNYCRKVISYLQDRTADTQPDYKTRYTFFGGCLTKNFGYSKQEKSKAAKALFTELLNQPKKAHALHTYHGALHNSRLGNLYKACIKAKVIAKNATDNPRSWFTRLLRRS